jgi:serine/threonine-protein kinase
MEYLPGMNVGELVDRYGPMPAARVIHLVSQTCDALAEAHGMGLVHRDIKPGNVFAAHRGGVYDVAKLVDFGLAKPLIENDMPDLTQEGAITGSPLFMSPEQALGENSADARSDIYSLGAVAYYLVTGQPPFNHDKTVKILVAHAHEEVRAPSLLRDDVPDDLERVILRCMAKDPSERYPSVQELRRDLAACADAGKWDADKARIWWHDFGCPHKKAFDAEALQGACA